MKQRHFILNKPYGYLSQFVLGGNSKKKLLGDFHDFPLGTMAIGRLDKDSEGLLLLTTDGKTSALINGNKVEKEYYVQVDGEVTAEALSKLREGVEISIESELYQTLPCKVTKLEDVPQLPKRAKPIRDERHGPTSWLSVILREGKFRQIRKMTAKVGCPTLRLYRVRIGKIQLGAMQPGEVLEVSSLDVELDG